ncbi:MAG TPA: hypothetical protein DCG53_01855 [Syntrophus sp. (in: bacteria)]|jgi:thiamine phosphate synthase YjbQ (UPF0047 family)|nr:hypothetical protein [Syntrophus sp. (in: bacteria)]
MLGVSFRYYVKHIFIEAFFSVSSVMHSTASVFINDHESGQHHDYEQWLEQLARHDSDIQYRHNTAMSIISTV